MTQEAALSLVGKSVSWFGNYDFRHSRDGKKINTGIIRFGFISELTVNDEYDGYSLYGIYIEPIFEEGKDYRCDQMELHSYFADYIATGKNELEFQIL